MDFDYNYPDFYDEKNYEYIDGLDVEKIKLNIESNRKISDDGDQVDFNFKPLDYDSYEFDDVGILNFNKPPSESLSQKTISKRRFRPVRGDFILSIDKFVLRILSWWLPWSQCFLSKYF